MHMFAYCLLDPVLREHRCQVITKRAVWKRAQWDWDANSVCDIDGLLGECHIAHPAELLTCAFKGIMRYSAGICNWRVHGATCRFRAGCEDCKLRIQIEASINGSDVSGLGSDQFAVSWRQALRSASARKRSFHHQFVHSKTHPSRRLRHGLEEALNQCLKHL
jgi:hypothetical protein